MSGVRTPAYPRCAMIPLDRFSQSCRGSEEYELALPFDPWILSAGIWHRRNGVAAGESRIKKTTPGTGFTET